MRVLTKLLILTVSMTLYGISIGCNKIVDPLLPVNTSPPVINNHAVYTAGFYISNMNPVPCYWSNNCKIDLPCGGTINIGTAHSIFVDGDTVYIGGYYKDKSKNTPCYWIDDRNTIEKKDLPMDNNNSGFVKSIFIYSNAVYSAGFYYDGNQNVPCYWAGTNKIDLEFDGSNSAQAYYITVCNGKVYTAGSSGDGSYTNACYWIGQKRHLLGTNNDFNSAVNSILVLSTNNILMAGCYSGADGKNIPCFWNNTKRIRIGGGLYNGQAKSLFMNNGNIYIAGYYFNTVAIPCYWEIGSNGTNKIDLPCPAGYEARAYSVYVCDNVIYTSGWYQNHSTNTPCYWMGLDRIDMPGEGIDETTCIYVK